MGKTTTKSQGSLSRVVLKLVLAFILALTLIPFMPSNITEAEAVEIGTADDMSAGANLTGTQVYFGEYNSSPILWYVVSADTGKATLWTTTSMGDRKYDTGTHNFWSGSGICAWLNGTTQRNFLADAFATAEQNAIVDEYSTTQESGFNASDTFIPNQKIVLPSVAEIGRGDDPGTWGIDSATRSFNDEWWLRSPGYQSEHAAYVNGSGTVEAIGAPDNNELAVHPAFKLNLGSVLFTSSANAVNGKGSVNVGDGLVAATNPEGTIKLTVKDSSQTLGLQATTAESTQTKSVTSSEALTFSYDQATTGANQYVSCLWTDDNANDAIKYYGKLADSSSAESGALSIPLAGVADGTYTVSVFSEQANADTYTDFASAPITMTVTVTNGTAAVSNFAGTVLSNNADLATVEGVAVSPVGNGSKASPKTASIAVATNLSKLALESIVTADANASAILFADSNFAFPDNPIDLAEGGATHAYILVTAQDGTLCYYDITIHRAASPAPVSSWFEATDTFTKGTNIELIFVADKDFAYYDHIEIDGKTPTTPGVPVVSGSTRAILKATYLETLSTGSHTVELFFTDNTSASGTFHIKAATEAALAKTGDTTPVVPLIACAVLACVALAYHRFRKQ